MNGYRALLAAIVLACYATVAHSGTPASPWEDTERTVVQHAIWRADASGSVALRFMTVQDGDGPLPAASREAPGLRLLDREAPPAIRVWPWALLVVALAGLAFLLNRVKASGRVVAVGVRRRPPPHPRRRS